MEWDAVRCGGKLYVHEGWWEDGVAVREGWGRCGMSLRDGRWEEDGVDDGMGWMDAANCVNRHVLARSLRPSHLSWNVHGQ